MKISECPYCGGQIGAIEYDGAADPGDRLERTDRGIPQVPEGYEGKVLRCGEYFGLDQRWTEEALRHYESNGYPEPCGYEVALPADIEAHLEERPRLFD
tara:strand:+ start:229 stop:525 length:297 start_codon:yes stop_codon:yes gene_type:complete